MGASCLLRRSMLWELSSEYAKALGHMPTVWKEEPTLFARFSGSKEGFKEQTNGALAQKYGREPSEA